MTRSIVSSTGTPIRQPVVDNYGADQLSTMIDSADTALECQHRLASLGLTLVDALLQGQEDVVDWHHYPQEDVYDRESGSQFYYHVHPDDEHGHFHLFHRPSKDNRPGRVKTPSHLMAITMDQQGVPIGLFTTNRWVTGERWRSAGQILELARHFRVEHAEPSLLVNRWITAMAVCCRPQLETLLLHRDRMIRTLGGWRRKAILENRDLEVIGWLPLDLPAWREHLESAMYGKEK